VPIEQFAERIAISVAGQGEELLVGFGNGSAPPEQVVAPVRTGRAKTARSREFAISDYCPIDGNACQLQDRSRQTQHRALHRISRTSATETAATHREPK
jgi:hypothetical protein